MWPFTRSRESLEEELVCIEAKHLEMERLRIDLKSVSFGYLDDMAKLKSRIAVIKHKINPQQ